MANAYIVTTQKLPAGAYGDLFTKVLAWIEGPGFGASGAHLYIQFSKLIEHLGPCNDAARVLALTGALTVLSAPVAETERFFRDPDSLLDAEEYDAVLAATVDALYARDPQSLVTLLCDRLDTTLGIEFPEAGTRPSGDEDISEAWISSFDDPAIHTYSIKQVLAKRLAEALVRAYDIDPAQLDALARALRARRFRVFTRLEAYLLLHAGDTGSALADAFVAEARHFWSYSRRLSSPSCCGVATCSSMNRARRRSARTSPPSSIPRRCRRMRAPTICANWARRQINYLTLLSGYLPPELDAQLAQLNETYGPSTRLVADVHEPAHAIGPESPWTDEQFRSFSATELAHTLNAQPYAEGPSEQLRRTIADEPARFVAALDAFDHLEPGYVRSVIMGFSLALRQAKPFDWSAVIAFAHRLLMRADARDAASDAAGDWSRLRYEIGTLLTDGTSNHYPRFERTEREMVLAIIERVLADEPPSAADPATDIDGALSRSLTDTRTATLRALIGVTFRFHTLAPGLAVELRDGVRAQPDAQALLEAFLAAPDAPIHVLFGERFDPFCQLDTTWARTAVPHIFPHDATPSAAMLAAWEAFVTVSRATFNCHDLLGIQYALATRTWPLREARTSNPDFSYPTALATHVIALFVHGRLAIEDALAPLYARISDTCAARALFRFAPYLAAPTTLGSDQIARLIKFWNWRTAQIADAPEQHQEELQAFGACFCTMTLPEAWALDQLKAVLSLTSGAISPGHDILKKLRTVGDGGLAAALDCLTLLIHGAAATHNLYWWNDDIQALLLRVYARGGALAQAARDIAGRLTAMRLSGYDDLFT